MSPLRKHLREVIMDRKYSDRKHFNEIMLNGTDEEILEILVTFKPEGQCYPILRDVLHFRNTQKLVRTTWWLVIATWALVVGTLITSFIQRYFPISVGKV